MALGPGVRESQKQLFLFPLGLWLKGATVAPSDPGFRPPEEVRNILQNTADFEQ